MAGGGGTQGQNQTINQVVNSQNLPAWQNAAYQQVASNAFGQAINPTTGLPNGLPATHSVAPESSALQGYVNAASGAPTIGNTLLAENAFRGYNPNVQAGQTQNALAGFNANIQAGQTPNAFTGYHPNIATSQVTTNPWNNTIASQYMNPYQQQVLQVQQQLANQQYGQEQAGLDQQAAASGALGGDRQAVLQAQNQHNYNLEQQNLQSNALMNAYNTAQQAFNNDANRQLQAGVENSQLGLAAGIQNANLGYGALNATNQLGLQNNALALQAAEQNAGLNLNAGSLTNQLGLQNNALALQAAEQNAGLNFGALQNTNQLALSGMYGNLAGINAAGQAGQIQQAYNQSVQDNAYNNALNQYLFPEQQLSYLNGILNGIPNQWIQQSDIYGQMGNPYTQALGAGIGGAAAQKGRPASGGGGGGGGGNGGGIPIPSGGGPGGGGMPSQPNLNNIPTAQLPSFLPNYQLPNLDYTPTGTDSNISYGTPGNVNGVGTQEMWDNGNPYTVPSVDYSNALGQSLNNYQPDLASATPQFDGTFTTTLPGFGSTSPTSNNITENQWPSYNPFDPTGTMGAGLASDSLNSGGYGYDTNSPDFWGSELIDS